MAGAVLLGPVGLVGGAFIKGKNIDYPVGSTVFIQPQDSVSIQGLVIGGDGLAHSDDELAEAVTVPTANDDSVDSTVDEADDSTVNTDEDDTNTADSEEVEDTNDTAENVSQPIVVVKRNQ